MVSTFKRSAGDSLRPSQAADLPSPGSDRLPQRHESPRLFREGFHGAVSIVLCLLAVFWMLRGGDLSNPANLRLFLFFLGLSLLTVVLPASGPRGQRVGMIPGVGMAALLLLPPAAALLPLLLANTAYAFSRNMSLTRRGVWDRGIWLLCASIAGSLANSFAWNRLSASPSQIEALGPILAGIIVYGIVYAAGRQIGLRRRLVGKQARRRAWASWRLEVVTLAVCGPVAALMALAYPPLGLEGAGAAAGLLGLLLLIAHFGFEVVLLREQVRAMEKISAVTLAQTSPVRVIERFLQVSTGLISCDRASLWLTDVSETRLDRVALQQSLPLPPAGSAPRPGVPVTSVRFGEGLVGRVADRQTPLIVRDGARDPRLTQEEQSRSAAPYSLLLLPLVAGGETMGVAQFERDAPGSYTNRELTRIRALAVQAAATIANVRMHQDIYNQAVTDGLTGLYNKRHMQSALIDERRRAQRYGHALSVIMLDVDGFKNYNDTYGHIQGDILLKMLAALLREQVRSVDIVGRFGGEEFIVVMPETGREDAWRTAERLRLSVAAMVFPGFADDPDLAVFKTISLGVATYPEDTDDTQALMLLADKALYRAKRGGRNQTVVAGQHGG